MTAVEIIDEIKHLPPTEQAHVVRFVRSLDKGRPWSGAELSEAAGRLANEKNPERVGTLKAEIEAGFYGGGSNA